MSRLPRLKAAGACSVVAILAVSVHGWADDKPSSGASSSSSSSGSGSSSSSASDVLVVTGKKKAPANSIDRRTYDVKDNPQAQTGTVGDALNAVPSVNVSPDGTVSVRGKENVEIYVNGKPSPMLQGDNRATTLQSLSGNVLDKVEVITNPSAQLSSNGGAILNLVLKKNKGLGLNVGITTNYGSEGRYNSGLNLGYNDGPLNIWSGLNIRHDMRKVVGNSQRSGVTDPGLTTWQNAQSGTSDNIGMWTGGDYRFAEKAKLGFHGYIGAPRTQGHQVEQNRSFDTSGTQTGAYERFSTGYWRGTYGEIGADFSSEGDVDGEKFELGYEHHRNTINRGRSYQNIYGQPLIPDSFDGTKSKRVEINDTFQLDAVMIFATEQRLSYGLKWDLADSRFDNAVFDIDPRSGTKTLRANTSNQFLITQTQSAAYVTFQQPLGQGFGGKWTLLAGVRAENMLNEFPQNTAQAVPSSNDLRINPSLHLSLDTSDTTKIKVSYARRLNRPNVDDLNPNLIYGGPQNVRSGNANLRPEIVDSFETGYEYARTELSYNADLYYRRTQGMISDAFSYYSPGVLLTSKQNLGESKFGGISFSLTAKPSKIINYSLNTDIYYNELPNQTVSLKARRSGISGNGKATFDYRPNDINSYQLSLNLQGPARSAQGSRSGTSAFNLSWKHKFSPKVSFVFTGTDLFDGSKTTNLTNTPTVNARSNYHQFGRMVFFGLSFTPTAKAAAKPQN